MQWAKRAVLQGLFLALMATLVIDDAGAKTSLLGTNPSDIINNGTDVLDHRISLTQDSRSLERFLDDFSSALSNVSGEDIQFTFLLQSPGDHQFYKMTKTEVGGQNVPARVLLDSVAQEISTSQSSHGDKVVFSWQLTETLVKGHYGLSFSAPPQIIK